MGKLRLIQCGVGGHGRGWVTDAAGKSDDFELVGMVDLSPKALAEAAQAVGMSPERCFRTLPEAIAAVDADAVLTVTPPPVHLEHARVAFAAGLHLMTEKPFADTIENARLMLQLANRAGRQLVVAQNYRYGPAPATLRRLMVQRPLGEPGHGHIDFYIPADFTGTFRQRMPYVLLVDMAIHHLDLVRFVTGRNIRRLCALTFNPPWSWYEHHAGLKLMMELDDGMSFTYSGDWSARGRATSWNGDWRVQCALGSIHLAQDNVTLVRSERGWQRTETTETVEPALPELPAQRALLRDFAAAIRTGQPAPTSGSDNLWSFGAVMAAVQSAQQGRPVDVGSFISGD